MCAACGECCTGHLDWRQADFSFCTVLTNRPAKLSPKRIFTEQRSGDPQLVTIERNWSPAPSFGAGLIRSQPGCTKGMAAIQSPSI